MKTTKIIIRLLISPFLLGIFIVTYFLFSIKRLYHFVKYGGEWINYDKNEKITIQMIYEELRHERLKREIPKCKSCKKPFNDLDMRLENSRPENICVACFTSTT